MESSNDNTPPSASTAITIDPCDFATCAFYIDFISSNLNKPLVDRENYPPSKELDNQETIIDYWVDRGLIPPAEKMFPTPPEKHGRARAYSHDPFPQRILRSIAYSLRVKYVSDIVELSGMTGLRIVDRADLSRFIFESDATCELWAKESHIQTIAEDLRPT